MEKKPFKINADRVAAFPSGGKDPAYQYRYYYWNPISAGDCHQINGTLMLRSDGAGTFDATVWTDGSFFGDVWHSGFSLSGNDGVHLFNIGEINSPTTKGEHVGMHGQFGFPAEKFGSLPDDQHLNQVVQSSSC